VIDVDVVAVVPLVLECASVVRSPAKNKNEHEIKTFKKISPPIEKQ